MFVATKNKIIGFIDFLQKNSERKMFLFNFLNFISFNKINLINFLGIISYMKEQAKPPSQEVKSLKEIEKSLGKIDSTVVGFFTSEEDPLYAPFMESGEFYFKN